MLLLSVLLAWYYFASLPVCTRILYSVESVAPDACGHIYYKTQSFERYKSSVFKNRIKLPRPVRRAARARDLRRGHEVRD